MYFRQFSTPGLGCWSYIIGCPKSGQAAVVDPRRDIGVYLEAVAAEGMRITHVFDTHVHADHVSGTLDLVRATGAEAHIHENAPVEYPAEKIHDGDVFNLGGAIIGVLHTPGHTPNSVSLLVSDPTRSPEPEMLLTGDLLFVGDTGRPDLPGREILDEQIHNLFTSLHSVLGALPEWLEIYPAHGQGSLCGGGMSAKPHSTLGYERAANPRLRMQDFEDFKKDILAHLPMRPQSFSHIIALNLKGAPPLRTEAPRPLSAKAVQDLRGQGALVLDLRDSSAFEAAHIPDSLHVDASRAESLNWIGTIVPPSARLILVLNNNAEAQARYTELARIGCDNLEGFLDGGIKAWMKAGRDLRSLPLLSVHELRRRLEQGDPPLLLDVRTPAEFAHNRIERAVHHPFDALLADAACPAGPETETVIVCRSAYRAAIAGSVLLARGCHGVSVLAGGMEAWDA